MNNVALQPRDLYEQFALTLHGQKLASESRFWPHVDGHITHKKWRELNGPDVNNLEHMRYTLKLSEWYIRVSNAVSPNTISDEDAEKIMLAAAIHDCAESIVGDTLAPLKGADADEKERLAYHQYIREFFPDETEETYEYLLTIVDEVVFGHNTTASLHFNAIENIGYLQTALKFYARATYKPESIRKKRDQNDMPPSDSDDDSDTVPNEEAREGMIYATTSVIASSMKRTAKYYDNPNLPAVRHFVNNRLELLAEATQSIPEKYVASSAFDTDLPDEHEINEKVKAEQLANFKLAKKFWPLVLLNHKMKGAA